MQPHMVRLIPCLTPNAKVRHVRVSLPLVPHLVDGERYALPGDPLPPEDLVARARLGRDGQLIGPP